ncbi:hypothetical protein WN51_11213 [Melipona quadrifasciata]|uniref:Uncharacterized protein n=1 Tax=Melipona quadrifasciata TaxID=166423 RepID=A0A0N0BIC7_9HYME|nr:hypothetical protein WN51_11213 [Melipona quadrifasciata]
MAPTSPNTPNERTSAKRAAFLKITVALKQQVLQIGGSVLARRYSCVILECPIRNPVIAILSFLLILWLVSYRNNRQNHCENDLLARYTTSPLLLTSGYFHGLLPMELMLVGHAWKQFIQIGQL